jgi:ABC-type multidrug transport system ATPase subunit
MDRKVIEALVRLFAILGRLGGSGPEGRELVRAYLADLLTRSQADELLPIYDREQGSEALSSLGDLGRKRVTVLSVKVVGLCSGIAEGLNKQQRLLVAIRVAEFIVRDRVPTELESDLLNAILESLNIASGDQADIIALVERDHVRLAQDGQNVLLIGPADVGSTARNLRLEGLRGMVTARLFPDEALMVLFGSGLSSEMRINGQLVAGNGVHVASEGASLRLGGATLHYSELMRHALGLEDEPRVLFEVDGVSFTFRSGHIGIHPLSFSENSGNLVGIMGGSGAGKSTLLNILNGNDRPTKGQVRLNGLDLHDPASGLAGVVGFVSQDDLLIEELTVFDNLYYSARLCYGDLAEAEVRDKVQEVLRQLGLDHIAHLQVGGVMNKVISGGQRKRLNIALELIREPLVLFADEPTSGLSSSDSEQVIDLLRQQALGGRLVFVVIHQPSSDIFKRFDKLLILDRGGYMTYYGEPLGAVTWFKACAHHMRPDEAECTECGNVNPEQIFNIQENKVLDEFGRPTAQRKVMPEEWYTRFNSAEANRPVAARQVQGLPASPQRMLGRMGQYLVFLSRDAKAKLRNRQFLTLILVVPVVLAALLALLLRNGSATDYVYRLNPNIPSYLFISVIVSLFLGLMLSAEQIIRDRLILRRESFLDLSSDAYLMAKVTVLIGITAIQATLFVAVGNLLIGLGWAAVPFWLILFATGVAACMMGLILSAYLNSVVTIYISVPLIIIPQILLSGVMVKYDDLFPAFTRKDAVPLVGELMVSKWAFEGLAVSVFRDNPYEATRFASDAAVSQAHFRKVHWHNRMEDLMRSRAKDTAAIWFTELTLAQGRPPGPDPKADLAALRVRYKDAYTAAVAGRDGVLAAQTAEEQQRLRDRYANDRLRNMLEGRNDATEMALVNKARIIPRYDPIYLSRGEAGFIRTPLYAACKPVLGRCADTFWVNMSVILLMALLLYLPVRFKLRA